jgi:hypothetical protein
VYIFIDIHRWLCIFIDIHRWLYIFIDIPKCVVGSTKPTKSITYNHVVVVVAVMGISDCRFVSF